MIGQQKRNFYEDRSNRNNLGGYQGRGKNRERVVVEVDEYKFGKRKYHKGHQVEGVWVVGGVE